ncbi:CPBP family intramembrane glutamic endopeptidase [Planctobacterium marinum]|uniref:CPBP family intramembrane glutamic endopeptidase n=1 Tax=Planctobacterium marinum TaxID=1631968 RepID=UPI001E2D7F5C|nr:CPBP family intramembrane glutamic endopeptidase [Planctobacterium marinum]MCC2604336.1 CPBP family intramembrane metalloprotease [Planctobacterium marinum]
MEAVLLSIYKNRRDFLFQLMFLFLATLLTQFSYIAYEKMVSDEDFIVTIVPSLLFLSLCTLPALLVGLTCGKKLGLGLVSERTSETNGLQRGVKFAFINGIALGAFLLAIRWGSDSALPDEMPEYGFRGVIGGFLVSLGASVGEEIWFRLGLMTLLLFAIQNLLLKKTLTDVVVFWTILVVGILFGTAHLPQLMSYGVTDAFAIWGTVIGNTCVSILYGWCFWRYGLISAIVAHFSLDLVLHCLTAVF